MIEIDSISMLIQSDTDISIEELERELKKKSFTLNYFPVSEDSILLADALNERTPNLYHEYFGGIEDLCLQIRLGLPNGDIWENVAAPRSATGPSLKKLAIGSDEKLGVPVQATLRIFHQPAATEVGLVRFDSEKKEKFFIQAMKKNRISVPLWSRMPRGEILPFFENLAEGERVVGLALWGEVECVESQWSFIQNLASKKGGLWYEIQAGKNRLEWLKDIRHHALKRHQRELSRPRSESKVREALERTLAGLS